MRLGIFKYGPSPTSLGGFILHIVFLQDKLQPMFEDVHFHILMIGLDFPYGITSAYRWVLSTDRAIKSRYFLHLTPQKRFFVLENQNFAQMYFKHSQKNYNNICTLSTVSMVFQVATIKLSHAQMAVTQSIGLIRVPKWSGNGCFNL